MNLQGIMPNLKKANPKGDIPYDYIYINIFEMTNLKT